MPDDLIAGWIARRADRAVVFVDSCPELVVFEAEDSLELVDVE
jgi:hypothetical protein